MMQIRKLLLVLPLAWVLSQRIVFSAFAESDWKLSVSTTYETSKYGADTQTETVYLPVTLKRYFDMGDISLTIPYISQKSSGLVSVVDGTTFKIRKKTGPTVVTTNSGLGDIILKGSFYLLQEQQKQSFDLFLIGKIKFPTADENKSLGTGEYDETVGLEFGKLILPEWSVFVDAYYTFIGSPSGTILENRFSFDVGLADQLTQLLTASIFYEESTPLINGDPNLKNIMVNLEYEVTRGMRVFAGGSVGLTDSSPDYGITAGASIKF